MLLVNPNSTDRQDKKSTIKKNLPVLLSGSVEDYLKWTNNMWYIIKNNLYTSSTSKFDTVIVLLTEEALEE